MKEASVFTDKCSQVHLGLCLNTLIRITVANCKGLKISDCSGNSIYSRCKNKLNGGGKMKMVTNILLLKQHRELN